MESGPLGPLLQSPKVDLISYWKLVPIDILSLLLDYFDQSEDIYKFCSDLYIFEKICQNENNDVWKSKFQRDFSQDIKLIEGETIMGRYLGDKKYIEYQKCHKKSLEVFLIEQGYEKYLEKIIDFSQLSFIELHKILAYSARFGYLSLMKLYIKNGANPADLSFESLCRIIENGHLHIFKYLLDYKNFTENPRNMLSIKEYKERLLLFSIECNRLNFVEFLLQYNPEITLDIPEIDFYLIIKVVERGYFLMLKYILDFKKNKLPLESKRFECVPNSDLKNNWNQLILIAISNNHLDIVKYLVEFDVLISLTEDFLLCITSQNLPIIEYLIKKGADVDEALK